MSEKPNKDVPHVSGAVDQKGQRILHGQVEGKNCILFKGHLTEG